MTTYDLMIKVKRILDEAGFETTSPKFANARDFEHQGHATKDGKSWYQSVKGYNFKELFGYTITFEVVHRHNGTDENKSVDVKIYKYNHNCGSRVLGERINVNHSEKQIHNRINKIIDTYNNMEVSR